MLHEVTCLEPKRVHYFNLMCQEIIIICLELYLTRKATATEMIRLLPWSYEIWTR